VQGGVSAPHSFIYEKSTIRKLDEDSQNPGHLMVFVTFFLNPQEVEICSVIARDKREEMWPWMMKTPTRHAAILPCSFFPSSKSPLHP
jgi:hypothetical protein